MTKEQENALHCLKVMIDEEVCEECDLYGTTGTDHCEADCVRVAIQSIKDLDKMNGIALDLASENDDLIEKLDAIIAEIDDDISHYEHFLSSNTANGLKIAKKIINKHRGESKNADSNCDRRITV